MTGMVQKTYNLTGDWPGRCNNIIWSCKNPDCDYRYIDKETMECPECGEKRRFCAAYPTPGKKKCRFHGGKVLVGADHPHYKGRGLSKNLPTRFLEQFQLSLTDPNVLDMTPEISLLEARLEDLIRKADEEPGSSTWKKIQATYTKFRAATRESEVRKYLAELDSLITKGFLDSFLWEDVRVLIDTLRRLKDSERKRRVDAEQVITESQFRTLMGFIVNSIETRVKNPDVKMAILADLTKLSNNPHA